MTNLYISHFLFSTQKYCYYIKKKIMFGKFYCKTVPVSIRSYCEERDIKYLHLMIFSSQVNTIIQF